jgi:hypothetical protein
MGVNPAAGLSLSWSANLRRSRTVLQVCRLESPGKTSLAGGATGRRQACTPGRPMCVAPVSQRPGRPAAQQVCLHRAVRQPAPQARAQAKAGADVALTIQLGLNLCEQMNREACSGYSAGLPAGLPVVHGLSSVQSCTWRPCPARHERARLTHDWRRLASYADMSSGLAAGCEVMALKAASAASMPDFMAVCVPCGQASRS